MIEELYASLADEGYSPMDDAPAYEYAERWAFNNALLQSDNYAKLFHTSAGMVEYRATGQVTPEDD